MYAVYSSLYEMGASQEWLITANVILSVLLATWMLRYRRLWLKSAEEQSHTLELIENLSDGIYRSSIEGRQLSANPALVKLNGYETEEEMLADVRDIEREWYVDPNRRAQFHDVLMREGKVVDFVSEIYRYKSRERIWITESARLVRDKGTGDPLYYEGSVREITETVKRLKIEEMFQKLTNQLPGGLFQIIRHKGGRFSAPYVSNGFRSISGFRDGYPAETEFLNMVHPDDRAIFIGSLRDSGIGLKSWDLEFRATSLDGDQKWVRVAATPEAIEDGVIWHGYATDISQRKRNEMAIEKLAFYDPLTDLPNRRMFLDRMAGAVSRRKNEGGHGALLFIDLDNFKTLNDTMGHDVGDTFLVQVAQRLRDCIGPEGLVARIGGDEFVIVLEFSEGGQALATRQAIVTANRVLSALRKEFLLGGLEHRSSASVGVVVFDSTCEGTDEVMKHADLAMYNVKFSGRNNVAFHDPLSMNGETERYRLLSDLKKVLSETTDQLALHFQPQLNEDGRVVGAEALLRWAHPEHGTMLPGRFLLLADQFGLSGDIGEIVLAKAIAALAEWQKDGASRNLRLAVNVSTQPVSSDGFVPYLAALLKEYGVDGSRLTLEVTEHMMAKDQRLIASRMNQLKELGVRLSLDDFGTGSSSLAQLKRLPFDELKIDGSFIADIEKSENDRSLVKTMLTTAQILGLTAVAEHVENMRQEAFLRAFGCDVFQGYHYSAALPGEEFLDFVRARMPECAEEPTLKLVDLRQA